jgi:hypothetical protein
MTLLAMRNINTGNYMPFYTLELAAKEFNIPINRPVATSLENFDEWLESVKTCMDDIEGYVIRFDDGFMCKIKTDSYCALHRAVSSTMRLGDLSIMIIDGVIDDLIPRLPDYRKEPVKNFAKAFDHACAHLCSMLDLRYAQAVSQFGNDRKSIALFLQSFDDNVSRMNGVIFKKLDSPTRSIDQMVVERLRHIATTRETKCHEMVVSLLGLDVTDIEKLENVA